MRKGWLGLASYLDANADVKNVCEGTNEKNDLAYYLNRERNTGDLHCQAPLLWLRFGPASLAKLVVYPPRL